VFVLSAVVLDYLAEIELEDAFEEAVEDDVWAFEF
jgi:hypothetical protein